MDAESSFAATDEAGEHQGRIGRATIWGKRNARAASAAANRARERHTSVDIGFRTAERQRRAAAMVLAGGIAYRIFFWLLAISVFLSGILGLFNPDDVEKSLESHGVAKWMAAAAGDITRSADGNSWWLLLVGASLVLWTGYACYKALVLAHAAIWSVAPPRITRPLRASLLFNGCTIGFVAAMAAARWVREQDQWSGFAATMLVLGIAFGFWLVFSLTLPNTASGWLDLVPGAALVAVGLEAIHLFTVYFLGPKLENATQLYGVFGIVTTLLFWFYLGGRLIVGGATLNVEFTTIRAAGREEATTEARSEVSLGAE